MAYENDLCELGARLADALDQIRESSRIAGRILADNAAPEGDRYDWPALVMLCDQLDVAEKFLATLPGSEIDAAIEAADKYLDEMSDRADGMSY